MQGGRFDWSGVGLCQAMTPWPALGSAKGWLGGSRERVDPRLRAETTAQGDAGEFEGAVVVDTYEGLVGAELLRGGSCAGSSTGGGRVRAEGGGTARPESQARNRQPLL